GTDVVRDSTPALAADLARLLREAGLAAGLFYLLPGANAFGAALLSGTGEEQAPWIEDLESGAFKALVVVENDPFWDYPDRERLLRALEKLELLVVLDYLPSPLVARADIVFPTLTLFERSSSSFVNQEGRLQLAPPVHLGGAPLAQISPELHPPRTFLSHVPGGEPRTPGEILAELAAALSPAATLPQDDLWDWLGAENPVFNKIDTLFEAPSGARLLPEEITPGVFSAGFGLRRTGKTPVPPETVETPPPDRLELLLTDLTFGTEELSCYSRPIQQVEEPPHLMMHPEDTAKLGLSAGDRVALRLPGGELPVAIQTAANMAPGVIVLPRHRQLNWRLAPDYRVMVAYGDIVKVEES
ncbi:MAG TPA: molybdopterin-dependent oxidoreductase, partial [Desulfobaccales bacterium]